MKECSFSGCMNSVKASNLCSGHYQQQKRGVPLVPLQKRTRKGFECKIDGCTDPAERSGLCNQHLRLLSESRPACIEYGCGAARFKRARCEFHYHVWYAAYAGDTLRNKCLRHDCQRPGGKNTRLCKVHYKQAWLYGLSTDEYMELWHTPWCSNPECKSMDRLRIDHDHACCPNIRDRNRGCGKCVRGLLCHQCNVALGMVNDDVNRLRGLVEYLQ